MMILFVSLTLRLSSELSAFQLEEHSDGVSLQVIRLDRLLIGVLFAHEAEGRVAIHGQRVLRRDQSSEHVVRVDLT